MSTLNAQCAYMHSVHGCSARMLTCTQFMAAHCTCMYTVMFQRAYTYRVHGRSSHTQVINPCSACLYAHTSWLLTPQACSQSMLSMPICTQVMAAHCTCMSTVYVQRTYHRTGFDRMVQYLRVSCVRPGCESSGHAQCAYTYIVHGCSLHMHVHSYAQRA